VVGRFRRGRLTADWDAQMDGIGEQETALEARIDDLRGETGGAGSIGETVGSAEALGKRLDAPVCWERKRRLIEVLVAGVGQTRTTVADRFRQPGQPMPVVPPQSYSTGRVVRIPPELNTVGGHIRRKRLDLKMLRREVAEQFGVGETSVFKWEANTSRPDLKYMPAVIRFLGYNPLPEGDTLGERLVRHRTSLGMTRGEAAQRLGVDSGTLARWERGERDLASWSLERAERFLDEAEAGLEARRVG
jgi:transcriptional regulator with XRE-family HTH domain